MSESDRLYSELADVAEIMNSALESLKILREQVRAMRQAQREYFRTRSQAALLLAKEHEKLADKLISIKQPTIPQPKLIEEPRESPEFPFGEFDNGQHWKGEDRPHE